jgi:hypothetical protein
MFALARDAVETVAPVNVWVPRRPSVPIKRA